MQNGVNKIPEAGRQPDGVVDLPEAVVGVGRRKRPLSHEIEFIAQIDERVAPIRPWM